MAFGDLTTLCDVKSWLQVGANPFPDTDDPLLTRLITAASQFIQTWLNRPLPSADWQEVRDGLTGPLGPGESRFVFGVQPCSAVLLVAIDGLMIPPIPAVAPAPAGQAVVGAYPAAAGYLFSPTQLVIRGFPVPRRAQCVLMQYTAGFASLPPDVAQACIELVCSKYRQRTRIDELSKHLGDGSTVTFSQKDMSDPVKTLLSQYRLVAPVFGAAPQMAPTATDTATLVGAL
jgi:Phage gp6-like head-tail connector protein